MIVTTFANNLPMPFSILAQDLEVLAVDIPKAPYRGDWCWCRFACTSEQYAFAGDTEVKNDRSSVIFRRYSVSDTVALTLWKGGVQVAELDDNTLGTFTETSNYTGQLYTGFLIDWGLVHTAHGAGRYQIKGALSILGQTLSYESVYFNVMPYNEEAADQTVRIETYQNGYTESADIDFSLMNWYSQTRLSGTMREKQPEYTTTEYPNTKRVLQQVQAQIIDSYTLELFELGPEQKDAVIYDALLANRIIVTDYSIDNHDRYLPVEIATDSIESLVYLGDRPGNLLTLKMKARQENILKRNIFF